VSRRPMILCLLSRAHAIDSSPSSSAFTIFGGSGILLQMCEEVRNHVQLPCSRRGRIGELIGSALGSALDERRASVDRSRSARRSDARSEWRRTRAPRGTSWRKVSCRLSRSNCGRPQRARTNEPGRIQERAANATPFVPPIWKDCLLDTDTPVSAFAKIRRGRSRFSSSPRRPAVRRGPATHTLAPSRAPPGGS